MSLLDRYHHARDRVVGWWHSFEAATTGSERYTQAADRFDRGQCMYDHPDGRWCFGTQTAGTAYCELHLGKHASDHDENWQDRDPDWHPAYDDGS